MARYIDADALIEYIDKNVVCTSRDSEECKQFMLEHLAMDWFAPTADVAPRAVVDRLRFNLKAVLDERAEDKAEVAREIFNEIRNILNKHYYACYQNEDGDECDAVISYLSYVAVDFDRLEQKYTEAETELPKTE